jgi:phosphatidate cytidylyltransferase
MASELGKRVAVAAVGIPLALALLYVGGWPLALVLAAIAAAAAAEFYRLATHRGVRPLAPLGVALAAMPVLIAAAFIGPTGATDAAAWSWLLFVALSLVTAAAAIFLRGVSGAPMAATALTLFGALFTGGTLSYAVLLRNMPLFVHDPAAARWVGPALLAFPLVLTWLNDTFAYFGGRRFGRRKLMPSVSPAKTVEGAVCGALGTVLAGALYAHFVFGAWLAVPLSAAAGAGIGMMVSPAAQLGDLAESLLKREAGVKDSGALLPGHGGVLDRFDSLFFSIPVTYWLLAVTLRGSIG